MTVLDCALPRSVGGVPFSRELLVKPGPQRKRPRANTPPEALRPLLHCSGWPTGARPFPGQRAPWSHRSITGGLAYIPDVGPLAVRCLKLIQARPGPGPPSPGWNKPLAQSARATGRQTCGRHVAFSGLYRAGKCPSPSPALRADSPGPDADGTGRAWSWTDRSRKPDHLDIYAGPRVVHRVRSARDGRPISPTRRGSQVAPDAAGRGTRTSKVP
jgi:hypothetical protein